MQKTKTPKFDQEIRYLTLLAINQRCIASDDYLSLMCHAAYQVLMDNTTLIFYNASNPLIDRVLMGLSEDRLIKRTGSSDSNSCFDQHFYNLTFEGAWYIHNSFRSKPEIIKLFRQCKESAGESIGEYSQEATKRLTEMYGPFISLERPITW